VAKWFSDNYSVLQVQLRDLSLTLMIVLCMESIHSLDLSTCVP